jgi:hypothetical protein
MTLNFLICMQGRGFSILTYDGTSCCRMGDNFFLLTLSSNRRKQPAYITTMTNDRFPTLVL